MNAKRTFNVGLPRFGVTNQAGWGFKVWDRHQHCVASSHKTFNAARKAAKKLNRPFKQTA